MLDTETLLYVIKTTLICIVQSTERVYCVDYEYYTCSNNIAIKEC